MHAARTAFSRRAGAALSSLVVAGCTAFGPLPPALTENDFATIRPGMASSEVLARFGRPTWVFGVRQENLSIWNYRYNRNDCIIYQVSVRPDGTVRDAAQGYDPACDRGDRL